MSSNWQVRAVVAAVVGIVLLASFVPVASAHAFLSDSDPGNGAQLDSVPDEVTLTFTGDGIQVADVTVAGPSDADVSGNTEIDPDDSQVVTVPVEDDGDGMYIVRWEVLADDGHTTSGTFFFVVGDEPVDRETIIGAHESDIDDDISWFEAGGKGLLLVGLVGVVGVPLVAAGAIYPVLGRKAAATEAGETLRDGETETLADVAETFDDRIRVVLAGLGGVLFFGVLTHGLARIQSLGSLSADSAVTFFGTPVGEVWLLQFGVTLALGAVLLVVLSGRLSRRVWMPSVTGGGLLVALTVAWTSHSATAIDRFQGTTVDFAHLFGAGLWVGGLLALAVWVSTARHEVDPGDQVRMTARIVRRFSVFAIAGVTLLVATGLVLADWHVGTTDGLLSTEYGLVLVAKLGLVSLALVFGAYNRFVLLGRLEARPGGLFDSLLGRNPVREDGGTAGTVTRLGKSVTTELAVLVVVLLLSGVLTSAATAAVVVADEDDDIEIATLDAEFTGDVDIEVAVLPSMHDAVVWVHEREVLVFETTFERDGQQVHADGPVELLATTEDGETRFEVELDETDDGRYTTSQTFPEWGNWEFRVTAEVDDSFGSAWFGANVAPEDMAELHGHDHSEHEHDHTHNHGDEDSTNTPFVLAALVVVIYGMLAIAYETHALRKGE